MRKMFRVMIAFLFGSQAYAQKGQKEEVSILFVGNSYTHMNDMPAIFDKIAKAKGKKVHVEKNTRSGCSFHEHTTRPDLFDAIKSRKWDYVVLQGYSRELTFPPNYLDTATMPFVKQLIDSVQANNACTNLLFYMTWGYKEGFEEREEIDTYEKMFDVISNGYMYMSDTLGIPVVPVGHVWKGVRTKYPEINLYDEDQEHPSVNGSYLSACTFYASIFNESPEGAITSTISSDNALKIQKTAGDYVLKNFEQLKLNKNFYKIEWKTAKDGTFTMSGLTNFEKATKITWDFGDNTAKSNQTKVTHKYTKAGKYKVHLTVEDECGVREISRTVKFVAPKKPKAKPAPKAKKGNTPKKKI